MRCSSRCFQHILRHIDLGHIDEWRWSSSSFLGWRYLAVQCTTIELKLDRLHILNANIACRRLNARQPIQALNQ